MENSPYRRESISVFRPSLLKRGILLVVIIIGLGSWHELSADDTEKDRQNNLVKSFFSNLYDFSFTSADSIIKVMQVSVTDQSTLLNIRANMAWWRILSGDEIAENIKRCYGFLDESIRSGQGNDMKDINSLYNIIFSYSLKARLENYTGNPLKAIISFYKAATFIQGNRSAGVKDEKMNLASGMYLYFMDYFERRYLLLHALFFTLPGGDKERGLAYLEKCSLSDDPMTMTEAVYFLMKIYSDTEKDYSKALYYADKLTAMHPANIVFCLERFRLLRLLKSTVEVKIYQSDLTRKIIEAGNINDVQKNHFLAQLTTLADYSAEKGK